MRKISYDLQAIRRNRAMNNDDNAGADEAPPKKSKVEEEKDNKPKKKINPKNNPNFEYCFRCGIYHDKDLHKRNPERLPVPEERPYLGKRPVPQEAPAHYPQEPRRMMPPPQRQMAGNSGHGIPPRNLQNQRPPMDQVRRPPPPMGYPPRPKPMRDPFQQGETYIPPPSHFRKKRRDTEGEEEENDFDYDDDFIDDDRADNNNYDYKKILRKVTKYNPEEYDPDMSDHSSMENRNYEEIEREDMRSKVIGRYEDRLEEERMQKMRHIKK